MKIIVTGSSSSIGKELIPLIEKHEIICLNSKICDLRDKNKVFDFFSFHNNVDAVIHLAARVGGVYENMRYPYEFLTDNLSINSNVIDCSFKTGIKNLIAISSTCCYPDTLLDSFYPMKENCVDLGPPYKTNYGYGVAKRAMQNQIDICNCQYGTNYTYLIPSNLYGKYSGYDEFSSHFLSKLIYKISQFNKGVAKEILMMGGSGGRRQFTLVKDLVSVLIFWIESNFQKMNCNVASPENITVKEITSIALTSCNCKADVIFQNEDMIAQLNKEVCCDKLYGIIPNFKFTSLEQGIKSVYDALSNNN